MAASKLPPLGQLSNADDDQLRCGLVEALNYGTSGDESRTKQAADLLTALWKKKPEVEEMLVDALWLCSSRKSESIAEALRTIITSLLKVEGRENFRFELQSALDVTLLGKVQLIEKEIFLKKEKVVNTTMHYKQTKYNLLHEESQGYAKLLKALFDHDLSSIKSLTAHVGAFDLDPNRVLDLLVDVMEVHADKDNLMRLIKDFSVDKLPSLLHFKITSYQAQNTPIPPSLYEVLVLFAKNDMLDLSVLTGTSWAQVDECYGLYTKFMKLQIREMNKVSLNSGSSNKGNDRLGESQRALEEAVAKLEKMNILVGLLSALLHRNEWDLACKVMQNQQSDWTKVCTLLPMELGASLCDYVGSQINEAYEECVSTPNLCSKRAPSGDKTTTNNSATRSLDQILESCSVALIAVAESGCLSIRPILFSQLCRLAKTLLLKEKRAHDPSPAAMTLFQSVLVPTLSLFPPNPALSADLWSVLSVLSYARRYQIYKSWRGAGLERWGLDSKPVLQVQAEIKAGKDARYSLKRLSKDNIRDMGLQISKVTHSNPLVVFTAILNQIESYDNMIEMMVDSLRFVTPLGLDVLGYCIMSRLSGSAGGVNRSRLKDDGVNVSQWLQSLESFTGDFYKKCPEVEFRGILCYLQHRLKEGHVLELGILKALIKTAGGFSFADYSPTSSLSIQQLEGKAGSQRLKRETFAFGVIEKFNIVSAQRVKSVLQSDGMGVTMLICLAQMRRRLLFDGEDKKPIKLVGNLLDSCQVVMSILLEFIADDSDSVLKDKDDGEVVQTALKKYASALPPLGDLFEKYHLDPVSAWMLCRPLFRDANSSEESIAAHLFDREPIVKKMLPESALSHINPSFYDAFFKHSLSDIYFPEELYETESARLKKEVERLSQKQKSNQPLKPFTLDDEMDLERCKKSSETLEHNAKTQKKRCEEIRTDLVSKISSFMVSREVSVASTRAILQHCTSPRCTTSPQDAMYCAKFAKFLHKAETPGFSMMHYVDELVSMVTGSFYCLTEDEAAAIGIVLLETWKLVSHWRYDDGAYKEEVDGKPGSFMVSDNGAKPTSVSFVDFKKLYNKWHAEIGNAAMGCFNGSVEYMHLRACFVILNRIVYEFPTRPKMGEKLMKALESLQDDTYPLQDIKTAAQTYGSLLIRARNAGVWKEEDAAAADARRAKEKREAEELHKRREEQMAEMAKDMKKIEAEIGDSGGYDRRGRPMFEPSNRTRTSSAGDRRGRDHDVVRRDQTTESQRNGDRPVDRDRAQGQDARRTGGDTARGDNGRRANRNEELSGLEGRWQRGQQLNQAKRDRSPDRDSQPATKRPRVEGGPRTGPTNGGNFEGRGNREANRDVHRGGDRTGNYTRRGGQQRR